MARPKEFDRGQVLDRAMDVFWEKGYESASLQDLVDRMAIGRASLYDTFGSKRELFAEALGLYVQRLDEDLFGPLFETGPVREVLGHFSDHLVEVLSSDGHPGCLLVKAALVTCREDAALAEQVAQHVRHEDDLFHSVLLRGQRNGELAEDVDLRSVAAYLTNHTQGLVVRAALRPGRPVLRGIADGMLAGLDAWLTPPATP